jgi:phage repressor protein C with HTH and peptisase S24 domain
MVYMETTGIRIRNLREASGESQALLARLAGVTKQAISRIERDEIKEPSASTLEPIARHYGVNLKWLLTGEGPKMKGGSVSLEDESWADILGVRQAVALGPGAEPDEYAETHKLKFRADSLMRKHLRPERLAVVYGKGDSMYPTIKDGDAILIDTGDREPKDEKLFVVTYGRDLLAKRLINLGGRWFIDSDNKADPQWRRPVPVDETKGFEIHGRVRWIGSWED